MMLRTTHEPARGWPMETFMRLNGGLIVFVYHCFDRIVINGYLSMLSRPENVVYFFHKVVGIPLITKEVLVQRTHDYQRWVEGFARNHNLPMQWAEKGVKKEEFVEPWLRRMERAQRYGVYFIFQSMEQGATLRSRKPKFATADPNYQILSKCRSRFTLLLYSRPCSGSPGPSSGFLLALS